MKNARTFCGIIALLLLFPFTVKPQEVKVTVDLQSPSAEISPLIYGQFIEHLGRCISGGIYEAGSSLSDSNGFRTDVLEKVKRLSPPLLRYPGGTFAKIYHWEDGIGPKESRPARPNLIWGGVEDNWFGTAEFIQYCRAISAEPFLVVNMATGTPDEAAHWVEYCNGTGNTYYANLRRAHGFPEPFNVKYWGLGNEEYAETDVGRHQDPEKYAEDVWLYAKMMKLTDPGLKLALVGELNQEWAEPVLDKAQAICDYLAVHLYASTPENNPTGLFRMIDGFETDLARLDALLKTYPDAVKNFNRWYRFPPRSQPIRLAIDEWGIWEPGGKGAYQLESTYTWQHALGIGIFLNIFQRHADRIGLATFAQLVNVLAPIMTDSAGSVCQTIFYPLEYYRKYAGSRHLNATVEAPELDHQTPLVDLAASLDESGESVILRVGNKSPGNDVTLQVKLAGWEIKRCEKLATLWANDPNVANTLENRDRNVVKIDERVESVDPRKVRLRALSITFYRIIFDS